jgi:ATP-dependent exoDNAse (exonuclease V) beta subunit
MVRIELSTIHKAKGLQFDTVIVPGLERLPRDDQRRLLRWSTQIAAHHAGLVVAPLAQTGGGPNLLYDWLKQQERDRLLQERRRLLYVAATRAQRWLHLIGSCALRVGALEQNCDVRRRRACSGCSGRRSAKSSRRSSCTAMCRRVTSTKRLRVIRRCAGCRRNGERRRPRPRRG